MFYFGVSDRTGIAARKSSDLYGPGICKLVVLISFEIVTRFISRFGLLFQLVTTDSEFHYVGLKMNVYIGIYVLYGRV